MNDYIESVFTYHAPKNNQPAKYQAIRDKAKELAYLLETLVPTCNEQSIAFKRLRECVMWANAGIAVNE